MGDLHSDENPRVLFDPHRRQLGIHIGQILFRRPSLHPGTDDIQECQHSGPRTVYGLLFELTKISPTGSSRVNRCCDSASKTEGIRCNRIESITVS